MNTLFLMGTRLLAAALLLANFPALASPPATPGLAVALNPDGSLRAGTHGSFDAQGYQMRQGANGQLVFRPAEVRRTQGAGDNNWRDGFDAPGTDGSAVYAVAADGSGNVYIGGGFTKSGGAFANYISKWNGTRWSALGAGLNSSVYALAVDGSGNVYAGGDFVTAGGAAANHLAKWNGTAWSALGAGLNDHVGALLLAGGTLYAGGSFTTAGGAAASRLAKWNGSAWSALGAGMDDQVYALALDGSGNLYAGGSFTTAGGTPASSIAKWNGSAWSALGSGLGGPNAQVRALAVASSGTVYAGGYFAQAGGAAASNVAQWNGTAWSALGAGLNELVSSLVLNGGTLTAGGNFTTPGLFADSGAAAGRVTTWNGSTWNALGAIGPDNTVYALAPAGGGSLYAVGAFNTTDNLRVDHVAKYSGTAWRGVYGGMYADVLALAVDGSGNVYAAGDFLDVAGMRANYIAKWNGSTWNTLGSGLNGGGYATLRTIQALALDGSGNLYAGGDFAMIGGISANNIAKWNGSAWSALGTGVDQKVRALAYGGGTLYAGGDFATAGGVAASRVAQWNGSAWSALGSTAYRLSGTVQALALDGSNNLYIGGSFNLISGPPNTSYLVKWNGTTFAALGTGVSDVVAALALDASGNLYAGGLFTTAGGLTVNHIARWNGTWSALGTGVSPTGSVRSLAVQGSHVYAGGAFVMAGGVAAQRVAQWDGSTWAPLGTGTNDDVLALAASGSQYLYAGGGFTAVGDGSKGMGGFGRYALTPVAAARPGTALRPAQAVLFPNPATAETTLRLLDLPTAACTADVQLLNALGQPVARYPLAVANGRAQGVVPVAGLAAGTYLLHITALDGRGQPIGTLPTQRLLRR